MLLFLLRGSFRNEVRLVARSGLCRLLLLLILGRLGLFLILGIVRWILGFREFLFGKKLEGLGGLRRVARFLVVDLG